MKLTQTINKKQYREIQISQNAIDVDKRTIELSFSSEFEVYRPWGIEILDHSPESVRLERLNSGAPFLLYHDRREQIGVIEKAEIVGRRGKALVRFSRSAKADEIFQDIRDGIRTLVSVGYIIHRVVLEEENDEVNRYRITDWEPFEISLEPTPADYTIGVGRNEDESPKMEIPIKSKGENMKPEIKSQVQNDPADQITPAENSQHVLDVKAERENVRKEELRRINEINAIAREFNKDELGRRFIDEGRSVEEFRAEILTQLGKAKVVRATAEIGMSEKDIHQYSFMNAIRALAMNKPDHAGFEKEVSDAVAKRIGKDPQGMFIPMDVMQYRDLTKGIAVDGGNLVGRDYLAGSFIEMLRNKMVLNQAGMFILDGLVGDVAIPSQTGGATAYWVDESGQITESKQAFGQILLTPHTVGALTDISRKLLKQSSPAVEQIVRNDLARTLAIELDRIALHGSGASNQPTGVAFTTGIGSVEGGENGSAPTWSHIVKLETEVSQDNADIGSLAYITNAKVRGKLKQTFKNETGEEPIWQNGSESGVGMLNGYTAFVTNQVSSTLTKGTSSGVCSAIFFGNWADLIMAMWGALDLTVDPYTGSSSGTLRVVALQDVDIAVRHAESFAAMLDALTT